MTIQVVEHSPTWAVTRIVGKADRWVRAHVAMLHRTIAQWVAHRDEPMAPTFTEYPDRREMGLRREVFALRSMIARADRPNDPESLRQAGMKLVQLHYDIAQMERKRSS